MPDNPSLPPPQDPFTELAAGAAAIHEMYASFVAAGFNEIQALHIVEQLMISGIHGR